MKMNKHIDTQAKKWLQDPPLNISEFPPKTPKMTLVGVYAADIRDLTQSFQGKSNYRTPSHNGLNICGFPHKMTPNIYSWCVAESRDLTQSLQTQLALHSDVTLHFSMQQ